MDIRALLTLRLQLRYVRMSGLDGREDFVDPPPNTLRKDRQVTDVMYGRGENSAVQPHSVGGLMGGRRGTHTHTQEHTHTHTHTPEHTHTQERTRKWCTYPLATYPGRRMSRTYSIPRLFLDCKCLPDVMRCKLWKLLCPNLRENDTKVNSRSLDSKFT